MLHLKKIALLYNCLGVYRLKLPTGFIMLTEIAAHSFTGFSGRQLDLVAYLRYPEFLQITCNTIISFLQAAGRKIKSIVQFSRKMTPRLKMIQLM